MFDTLLWALLKPEVHTQGKQGQDVTRLEVALEKECSTSSRLRHQSSKFELIWLHHEKLTWRKRIIVKKRRVLLVAGT
ncbi:hypothetical protein Fmac_023375 [Flemingia macrophylla]|uniref:Uncharacterized protein n=1 Tax=Flemingia macrophylla TaxID=520843 RepID=A0ABD1LLD1_9FABA